MMRPATATVVIYLLAASTAGPGCKSDSSKAPPAEKASEVAAGPVVRDSVVGEHAGHDTDKPPGDGTEPLFEGMGDTHHEITTKVPDAQKYFDQGMVLAWGFNHDEAGRSFLEAAKRDPECAMCYWGASWVLGPNINSTMETAAAPKAWEMLQKAVALKDKVSDKEQAYIGALEKRYAQSPPEDRAPLDQAFADAMREVVKKYPDDLDAKAILAEALMNLHPWNYWDLVKGKPRAWTPEILKILQEVLAKNERHVAANHLLIHVVEASPTPELGNAAADRLATLVPGAGHLVHMPAHIYLRIGRYAEASAANEAAIKADQGYITQCRANGFYPTVYHPHNWHFLWMSATFEGRSARAIEAAKHIHDTIPKDKLADPHMGILQHFNVVPLYAYARFGKWAEILATPEPEAKLEYPKAVWHYTRGLAQLHTGKTDEAQKELEALRTIVSTKKEDLTKTTLYDINSAYALMQIGEKVLSGEIAAKKGDFKSAIKSLVAADKMEKALNYDEPPDWYYPVRHSLGAVYLEAKKPKDAEKIYRADLQWYPENGFALFGLRQALEAQGKKKEAEDVQALFDKTWAKADHKLTSSRF